MDLFKLANLPHRLAIDLVLLLLFFPLQSLAYSLEITKFEVPSRAISGNSYQLICIHNLDTTKLYLLQWSKGDTEFFRYEPKAEKRVQVFPIPGINLNMKKSLNGTSLILEDVDEATSGLYKCDVTEDVSFFTVSREQRMTVTSGSVSMRAPHASNSGRLGCFLTSLSSLAFASNFLLICLVSTANFYHLR